MSYTTGKFTVDEIGFIQSAMSKVLAAVARGELDLNLLAREELAARGQDLNGVWVGFKRADELHFGKKSTTPAAPEKHDLQATQLAHPLTDEAPDRITYDRLVKFWRDGGLLNPGNPLVEQEVKALADLAPQGRSGFDPSLNDTFVRAMTKWSNAHQVDSAQFYAHKVIALIQKLEGAEAYLKNKENLSFHFAKQPIIDVLSIKNNELLINTFALMGCHDICPDVNNKLYILNAVQDSSTINIESYHRMNNEPQSDEVGVVFTCSITPDWLITCSARARHTDLVYLNLPIPDALITHRLSDAVNNVSKHLMKAVQGMLAEYGLATRLSEPEEAQGGSFLEWNKDPGADENQDDDESSVLNPCN